jgi:hypothetical protein
MSHFISLAEAKKMTAEYRSKRKDLLDPKYKDKDTKVLPTCESFERSAIEALLKNPECKGLRIYYGIKNEDELHAIIVGYDGENKDILPSSDAARTEGEEGEILDNGYRCPVVCPPSSDLNR